MQRLHERLSHSADMPQRILVPPLVALRANIELLGTSPVKETP